MPEKSQPLADTLAPAPAFATTHWSVVLAAGADDSPQAQAALTRLCRTYWYPIYAYVRRGGVTAEDAQDLTQGFFARLLERRDLGRIRQEKGRFRSYLLTALKHYLINERQRDRAEKRGGKQALIPLDEALAEQWYGREPVDQLTADRIFERRWALTLLEQVLHRLGTEYSVSGNARLFERLNELLSGEPDRPSQAQIAADLGMSENAVKQAFHRLRLRYRKLLRQEIAQTVGAPGDIEDELRHLIAVLRA